MSKPTTLDFILDHTPVTHPSSIMMSTITDVSMEDGDVSYYKLCKSPIGTDRIHRPVRSPGKKQMALFPLRGMTWHGMARFALPLGVRRSNIQYRYYSNTGIFCWIGLSVRRDQFKSDIVHIIFSVIIKPHKSHTSIIKHNVFVHYIFKCSEAVP